MENQQKSRSPDNSETGSDKFGAMNRPTRQSFTQFAQILTAILDEFDAGQANLNSPVAGAEGGQDLGLERGTYISENKNDAKCTSEHDSSDEEPLKAPDIPNVKKATGNDFMEIRDLKFSCSIVGDSIPFFFRPRTSPTHSSPLIFIRGGKQSRNPPKEAVEDGEDFRKNAQPSNLEDERKQSQRQLHPNALPCNLENERKQSQRQLHQNAQPAILKDERTQSQSQWYRSRKERSKTIARTNSSLKFTALIFTFITALFIILLIKLLKL